MTIADVLDIHEYWREFPPLVEIVGMAVGMERKQRTVQKHYPTQEEIRALVAQFGKG